jgi:hypothetical protein
VKTVAAVALGILLTGCFRTLPPAEPPPPRNLDLFEPTAAANRITLDVGPERVRVDEVLDTHPHTVLVVTDVTTTHTSRGERTEVTYGGRTVTDSRLVPLCEAPCVLALAPGPHELHLQALDDGRWAMVHVDATAAPQTYRVGLGHTPSKDDQLLRYLAEMLLLSPGVSLLGAGAVDWASVGGEPTPADQARIRGDAAALSITGGVLLAAGIVASFLTRPVTQETIVRVDHGR